MADYVVVGGGIAATQAAETVRKLRKKDAVTLVAEEERPFYLRPLLADFVAGRVEEARLWRNFDSAAAASNIRLITGKKVTGIDRAQRSLVLDGGTKVRFDKLLVATGVKPHLPDIPGVKLDRVTGFSQYADAVRVKQWAEGARTAVVVGRGLQGVELTRALRLRGLDVTMIVPDESPWFPALFQVRGDVIERKLEERGVKVIALDQPAEVIGRGGRAVAVKTRRGSEIPAEIVGFALDQRTSVQFLVGSGISLADGVVVDSRLQSTDENVYAAGDVAQLEIDGRRRPLGYGWLRATQHGEAAGRNMGGEKAEVEVGDETEAQALYGASLLARWG
jgi:3-phenylpropionate/trans-cinnamate dioxygenase ferredoxin reductase subunit